MEGSIKGSKVMIFIIENLTPQEFAPPHIISIHKTRLEANAQLDRLMGVRRDSYMHQYVKMRKVDGTIEELLREKL
jgi:hypothetical protein